MTKLVLPRRSVMLQELAHAARYFYPRQRLPLALLLGRRLLWQAWARLGLLRRPAILALDAKPRIELLVPDLAQEYELFMYRAPLLEAELFYLPRIATPAMTVLNIGANVGLYALAMARLSPYGAVHAFEPAAATYRQLSANVAWNQLRGLIGAQITCHRLALSDQAGWIELYHYPSHQQASLIAERPDQPAERVPTLSLDAWCEQQAIMRVDLMLIDVEGAEERVLRGATRLLAGSHPPLIMCELNKKFATPRPIWDLLSAHGYHFWHYRAAQDRLVPVTHPLSGEIYTHRQGLPGLGYGNVFCAPPSWMPPS